MCQPSSGNLALGDRNETKLEKLVKVLKKL